MIADLHRADPLVRHVAVSTRDTRASVDSLVPHLELRMLRLEDRRSGLRMRPVLVSGLLVERVDVVDPKPLRPRVDETLLGSLEVVLVVTLPADEAPHLLPRRIAVHVVVLHALRSPKRAHAFDE